VTVAKLDQDVLPELVKAAARGASNLQAEDIVILDVGDVFGVTDYFLIASASNVRQVRRIAEEIDHQVKAVGGAGSKRQEGVREGQWVLLDFGEFVVHVFHAEQRKFYDLERLWSDVPTFTWIDENEPVSSSID
jgi:ribosome-associated protein